MPNIGPLEIAIVLVIVLLIFGPKRLPGLGKQLGTGMREFKDSISGKSSDADEDRPAEAPRAVAAAPAAEDPSPATDSPDASAAEERVSGPRP